MQCLLGKKFFFSFLLASGDGDDSWNIAHVPLSNGKKFRYFFQGIAGVANQSSSGISIDDITLTETTCPSAVWHIKKWSEVLDAAAVGSSIRSGRFYNSEGYGFGFTVYPKSWSVDYPDYLGVTIHLYSGENDGVLEWPAVNRQFTITVMDQDPDATLRMSNSRSYTTGKWINLAFVFIPISPVRLKISINLRCHGPTTLAF